MPARTWDRRWVTAIVAAVVALGCARPSAKPYVGDWKRSAEDGSAVRLTVRPTAAIELRLSNPPRPVDSLMKGPGEFRGDTLTFSGAPCERGAARYLLELKDAGLSITPLGSDGCTLRRQTLSGSWTRQ